MNTARVLTLLLVLVAVFVFVVAMFFFFGKKDTKPEKEDTRTGAGPEVPGGGKKVLNVLTYLPTDKANALKARLGESYLFDARSKANTYEVNGVTVSVFSSELESLPGYTKYVHTLPKPFKGESVVFDGETSNHFFEDPVVRLTSYMWFDTLLFLTFTTETEAEPKVKKFYHYTVHKSDHGLKWDRFDRDPNLVLDTGVLGPKLDELNLALGNFVALNLDEYLDGPSGNYTTTLNTVVTRFNLLKRSSSQTGFVKVTHKLGDAAEGSFVKPFKVKRLNVSGTELTDLVLPNRPVVTVSVFWWYNVPLLAELELHGGDKHHLSYNVDTNNWESEVVEKLRSKLFLLKNRLGDPLTLDLSKTPESDQTYTSNGVLVRVTPGATSVSKDFKKFTHRFTSSSAHFVGSFVNAGTPQVGLPVVRLNELSAYYLSGVPVLLKLNLATAGSLSTKHRYYSNNGFGVWSLVELTQETTTTQSLLTKFVEEAKKLVAESDKYVLDARMKSNYLSKGKLVKVVRENFDVLPGFTLFNHNTTDGTAFKFEKFTVAGKDVTPSAEELVGAEYGKVYWFMEEPLLLKVHGTTTMPPPPPPAPVPEAPPAGPAPASTEFNHFFSFDAETKEWKKVEKDLNTDKALKEALQEVRTKLGTVTLNLANESGDYVSGMVTVNVVEATPFENDPPTSFTKRVHTLSTPFPVDNLKHFDFDLALARKDGSHYHYAVPVKEPVLPYGYMVSKLEVYFYGEVPLHFVVHSTTGAPLRYSNTFRGTLWVKDEYSARVSLLDVLVPLRVQLTHFAKLDVCKDVPANTTVTYRLKHLAGTGFTDVTLTKSAVGADGVTVVTHKLPENVNLKFTSLTCGDKVMTGMDMESVSRVLLYSRNTAPLFVKTNSTPKFYVATGEGALKRYTLPEGAETLNEQQLSDAVSRVAKSFGNVYDVDVLKKEDYQLLGASFTVVKQEVKTFMKYVHKLKTTVGTEPAPFVVRLFKHGNAEAVLFPTGLRLVFFSVYYHEDKPLYMRLKSHGPKPKFYHYVYDNGLWLGDGVHEHFEHEEVVDRLDYLKDGLGNQFSLNLGEDVDNPLFKTDTVDFDLVPGFVKHTYKSVGLEYPLLLQNLTLDGQELNLPLVEKHMNLFTAFSFRKNFLFFHLVTHENNNLFFKANFQGGFVPHTFETFDDEALKSELFDLRAKLANQFSLELTKKESYTYHNFNVKVVKQVQVPFEGYDKYLHDLVDGDASVPFKLVSVKDNGYVTNVPEFKELVYFAYVYMHEDSPLLLELHSSTMERTDYHYYYFYNNLGNWQLLQNPTLGQLSNTRVNEVLERSKNQLAGTFKLDLARKFSYNFTNGANDKYFLESVVAEDTRSTLGFSMYGHNFTLKKGKGVAEGVKPPTAENLGGVTVLPPADGPVPQQSPVPSGANSTVSNTPGNEVTSREEQQPVQPAGLALAPKAAVPSTEAQASVVSVVEPPVSGQSVTPVAAEPVLTTYETLLANAFRGANLLAGNLPVVAKVTVGDQVVSGFGVDTVLRANVYWWHDKFPALVHLFNGMEHKYYAKQVDGWVLVNKVEQQLPRSALGQLLSEVKETFVKPVEVDLDKSSDFDSYVKYVSEGLTLRVVPSHTFPEGFKGFTHFSATQYERAFRVERLTLWGDDVVTDLPDGFVKSVTVFTDSDLLPLAAEVEWTKVNNASFVDKYKYFKNNGSGPWVVHRTDDTSQRLSSDVLLGLLKEVKQALGERVLVSLEKREDYAVNLGATQLGVKVVNEPASRHSSWNGFHKVRHEFVASNAPVLLMKHGDRVLRAHRVATHFKAVDSFWFKNALLLVRLTVAGPPVTTGGTTKSGPDTYVFFKNDFKDDLMPFNAPTQELVLNQPAPLLVELATPFKDHFHLDVAERTLRNSVDFVKHLPALYVLDTAVPQGFARYNLYVLDHLQGVRLSKLLYHGRDVSTGHFKLPELNVNSVYAFTPVGHFSPFLLEFHVRGPGKLLTYYYHLNQFGEWVALETGARPLTVDELQHKLSVLTENLGNVNVVDLSKTEGSYYGLNKVDVTKFQFPGARGFTKFLHRPHDGNPFTVSKFVNKGVVLGNLPVLKVNHVAVYNTRAGKPLLLELRMGGKYKFFASNSNGAWFEERLPSGDLLSALKRVYDEHNDVARQTGDLVSLHLNADFVREYVLTEGKVDDFDGAVAVHDEEPEPVPAPLAESLLPDDSTGGDADPNAVPAAPTLQGATRPVQPPAVAVTRSHVLNPVLYVESDKLAYGYPSYGKSVFVTRRDDMFHGFNVTVHRLPENEPFVLKRVVFLGTEFDLGVGQVRLLSATTFSFLHTPLVLKLVLEDGKEKFFSFNFATQTWSALEVSDLMEQLDRFNFEQNKMVVLDLGKDTEYDLYGQKLVVEKASFGQYTRLTTRSETAVESKKKRVRKRHMKHVKRVQQKNLLKAELEEKKLKLEELRNSLLQNKKTYDGLVADWDKFDSDGSSAHKKLVTLKDIVANLKKVVPLLENELEVAKALKEPEEKVEEKKKELEQKKKELSDKEPELEKLLAEKSKENTEPVSQQSSTDVSSLPSGSEGDAANKVEALLVFSKKLKDLDSAPTKLQEASDLAGKLKEKYTALNGAQVPTSEVETNEVDTFVETTKSFREAFTNVGTKLHDVFEFVKALKNDAPELEKFNEANTELDKLKVLVSTFVDVEKSLEGESNVTSKRSRLFEAAKKLKDGLSSCSFEQNKFDLTDALSKVKESLAPEKTEQLKVAPQQFKEGVEASRELHEKTVVEVAEQEELVDAATKRHDLYKTEVDEEDSDDDGTVSTTLLFGFGGLRLNGKDLPSAGLPLGTHLYSFNAFFPTGYSKPLMLQLKYRDSDDVDEPVLERLLAPPAADSLDVADRQTVPAGESAPGTQQSPAAPATTGVTGTVQKVTELLQMGLQHTTRKVELERQAVVTGTPATLPTQQSPAAPVKVPENPVESAARPSESSGESQQSEQASRQSVPTGPSGNGSPSVPTAPVPEAPPAGPAPTSDVQDVLVYPGRFFVWDVDGTWKQFVPEGKGALKTKLDELKAKHALVVDLDLAKNPGTRRTEQYLVGTDNFVVRRVLFSSAYKLTRDPESGNLQGGQSPKVPQVGPHVVNLDDFDASVKFFPTFNYHWYLHHKAPLVGDQNKVESLPGFTLQGLNLNGVPLNLDTSAPEVLAQVHSVSAVLNANGTPLLLFVYKPVQSLAAVKHNYSVLALKGDKYVVTNEFGNHHDLLFKLEHTQYEWRPETSFDEFRALMLRKLEEVDLELEPSYVVDLAAKAHYKNTGVVVNVEVSEAFGVKHVSYTPGLVKADGKTEDLVPAFVLQKVFLDETVFKGFRFPARNVLHVTAFHWKFLHLLKNEAEKEFTDFPLLLELSFRNESNRLVHHYYQYLGGDRFELHSKTKLRLTAAEVADVVRTVAHNNLRVSNAVPNVLNVDLALQFTHYTPGHKLLVEKLVKKTVTPVPESPADPTKVPTSVPEQAKPVVVNGFVPDGYVLLKFELHKDDPGYTFVRLFFEKFWAYLPTKYNYKVYYAYVKEHDTMPVLVAMGYTETNSMKFDWLGLHGNKPAVLFDTATVSPLNETDKPKVEAELNKLTAEVDFWWERKPALWTDVKPGLNVKLSPVGGLGGFPKVPKNTEQRPAEAPSVPTHQEAPKAPVVPSSPPPGPKPNGAPAQQQGQSVPAGESAPGTQESPSAPVSPTSEGKA